IYLYRLSDLLFISGQITAIIQLTAGTALRSSFGAPFRLGGIAERVDAAGEHEEKIGETVEVEDRLRPHGFRLGEADDQACGTAANGAGEMEHCGSPVSPGENEMFERLQERFDGVDLLFEAGDVAGLEPRRSIFTGCCEVGTENEEIVLNFLQDCVDLPGGIH